MDSNKQKKLTKYKEKGGDWGKDEGIKQNQNENTNHKTQMS